MGCQLSVPDDNLKMKVGKSERQPRTGRSDGASKQIMLPMTTMKRHSEVAMTASTSSRAAGSTVSLDVDEYITDEPPKIDSKGHLMPEEVVRRTSASISDSRIMLGDKGKYGQEVRLTYAYRSQRGYYPDEPKKYNQDKYGVTQNFAGEPGDAVFAVYDGHGGQGHNAALFARNKLPQVLAKHIRQRRVENYIARLKEEGKPSKGAWNPDKWPLLDKAELERCCRQAFLETNHAMHKEQSFTDLLCGTTAAAVLFHGGKMTVCNVGDSRIVLGHRVPQSTKTEESMEEEKIDVDTERSRAENFGNGQIVAIPLTMDQTPYRRDERERVIECGAEIRSIEGKTNEDWGDFVHHNTINVAGDPPRIWFHKKEYPGCAFTRSLGDRMAEEIGVTAEPEILTKTLTKNDEFLVIASDGIFEFLTNEYVINVCAMASTPLEACEVLTRAAYDQWLVHENRTDDITIIVCFLSSNYVPTADEVSETTESLIK